MKGQLFEFAGKLCLALLSLCILFHAMFLAMAYAVERFTDPPACQVAYAFPMPYAVCPGFGLGLTVEYFMALPGAVLALPMLLPGLLTDPGSALQPYVAIPMLIHLIGWTYLIASVLKKRYA